MKPLSMPPNNDVFGKVRQLVKESNGSSPGSEFSMWYQMESVIQVRDTVSPSQGELTEDHMIPADQREVLASDCLWDVIEAILGEITSPSELCCINPSGISLVEKDLVPPSLLEGEVLGHAQENKSGKKYDLISGVIVPSEGGAYNPVHQLKREQDATKLGVVPTVDKFFSRVEKGDGAFSVTASYLSGLSGRSLDLASVLNVPDGRESIAIPVDTTIPSEFGLRKDENISSAFSSKNDLYLRPHLGPIVNGGGLFPLTANEPAASRIGYVKRFSSQAAARISELSDDVIELCLSSDGLGEIRMLLQKSDGGRITIWAERVDVVDMIRRNLSDLQRDLIDMGAEYSTFSFGDGNADSSNSTPSARLSRLEATTGSYSEPPSHDGATVSASYVGVSAIDLRV